MFEKKPFLHKLSSMDENLNAEKYAKGSTSSRATGEKLTTTLLQPTSAYIKDSKDDIRYFKRGEMENL